MWMQTSKSLPSPTEGKHELPRRNKPSFQPTYSVQLPYTEPVAKGGLSRHC